MAELTFGGKAVGVTFNPSNNDQVDSVKAAAANLADQICGALGQKLEDVPGEVIAMRKLALRKVQEASMWAVKAETWED